MLTVAAPLLHNSVPAQLVAVIVVLAPDTILLALGVNVGAIGVVLTVIVTAFEAPDARPLTVQVAV